MPDTAAFGSWDASREFVREAEPVWPPASGCRTVAVGWPAMKPATTVVFDLVERIAPCDDLERQHRARARAWLCGTDDIFRRIKPDVPSPHLVSYVVLVDPAHRAVYLGRHRKAGLNLPMGGHVEPGEHPLDAAYREA